MLSSFWIIFQVRDLDHLRHNRIVHHLLLLKEASPELGVLVTLLPRLAGRLKDHPERILTSSHLQVLPLLLSASSRLSQLFDASYQLLEPATLLVRQLGLAFERYHLLGHALQEGRRQRQRLT